MDAAATGDGDAAEGGEDIPKMDPRLQPVTKSGYLMKKGGGKRRRNWTKRWFSITAGSEYLVYHRKDDMVEKKGEVLLFGMVAKPYNHPKRKNAFLLSERYDEDLEKYIPKKLRKKRARTYFFTAPDEKIRYSWVNALNAAALLVGAHDRNVVMVSSHHLGLGRMQSIDDLGQLDAVSKTVKKAYRRQVVAHHPDKGGDPAKFSKISDAHEVMNDILSHAETEKDHFTVHDAKLQFELGMGLGLRVMDYGESEANTRPRIKMMEPGKTANDSGQLELGDLIVGVNGTDTRGFPFDLVLAHIQAATCTPPELTLRVLRRKKEFGGALVLEGDNKWEGDPDFVPEEKNLESEIETWREEEEARAAAMEVRWQMEEALWGLGVKVGNHNPMMLISETAHEVEELMTTKQGRRASHANLSDAEAAARKKKFREMEGGDDEEDSGSSGDDADDDDDDHAHAHSVENVVTTASEQLQGLISGLTGGGAEGDAEGGAEADTGESDSELDLTPLARDEAVEVRPESGPTARQWQWRAGAVLRVRANGSYDVAFGDGGEPRRGMSVRRECIRRLGTRTNGPYAGQPKLKPKPEAEIELEAKAEVEAEAGAEKQEEDEPFEIPATPTLMITVRRGSCLPDVQWWGQQDPYVTACILPSRRSRATTSYDRDGDIQPQWDSSKKNRLVLPIDVEEDGDQTKQDRSVADGDDEEVMEDGGLEVVGEGDSAVLVEVYNANYIVDSIIGSVEVPLSQLKTSKLQKTHLQLTSGGIIECDIQFHDGRGSITPEAKVDSTERAEAEAGKSKKKKAQSKPGNAEKIDYEATTNQEQEAEGRVLCVEVLAASGLPDRQTIGKMDPLAELLLVPVSKYLRSLQQISVRTRAVENGGCEPRWGPEECNMLSVMPGAKESSSLHIKLWNDNLLIDDLIAEVEVPSDSKLIDHEELEKWQSHEFSLKPEGKLSLNMGWLECVPKGHTSQVLMSPTTATATAAASEEREGEVVTKREEDELASSSAAQLPAHAIK